jgi:hypothetical protein
VQGFRPNVRKLMKSEYGFATGQTPHKILSPKNVFFTKKITKRKSQRRESSPPKRSNNVKATLGPIQYSLLRQLSGFSLEVHGKDSSKDLDGENSKTPTENESPGNPQDATPQYEHNPTLKEPKNFSQLFQKYNPIDRVKNESRLPMNFLIAPVKKRLSDPGVRPNSNGDLGQELGFLGDLLANQYCPFGSARSLDDRKFSEMECKYQAKKVKLHPKHDTAGRKGKKLPHGATKSEISNLKGRLLLDSKTAHPGCATSLPKAWLNSKRLRDFKKICDQPIDQDSFEKIYEWIDMDVIQGGKNLSLPEKKVIMIARA